MDTPKPDASIIHDHAHIHVRVVSEGFMSAADTLNSLLEAMLAWEISLNSKKRGQEYNENAERRNQVNSDARKELASIFEKFLTERAITALGKAKMETLGTGRPPEYEQEVLAETLTSEGKGVSVEAMRNKGLKQRFKYVFVESSGGFKLNDLYIYRGEQEGWKRRASI